MPHDDIHIVDYQPWHQQAFAQLNYAWIERYFRIEAADRASLEHPQSKILAPGGAILMAVLTRPGQAPEAATAVGTCALIPLPEKTFELAKMAVSEQWQGHHIGQQLGDAAIAKAMSLGGRRLWLESNTVLEPAITLYGKLGFKTLPQAHSDYARSNIQMELTLPPKR